ncbi:MAG: MarR family winged helix-turn-helix transcriptional regulator [Fastidiosipilaceae bacterium]
MNIPLPNEPDGEPAMRLAWLLRDINQMTQSILSQNIGRHGLYVGQPRILRVIHDHPGETQRQIADRLFVSGASLSTSLKRLQKANLVERRLSETDRRRHELYLTPEGEAARTRCGEHMSGLFHYMLTGLAERSVNDLLDSLETIRRNLTTRSSASPIKGKENDECCDN